MDFENEIRSVSAETLAYGMILGNVLGKLTKKSIVEARHR